MAQPATASPLVISAPEPSAVDRGALLFDFAYGLCGDGEFAREMVQDALAGLPDQPSVDELSLLRVIQRVQRESLDQIAKGTNQQTWHTGEPACPSHLREHRAHTDGPALWVRQAARDQGPRDYALLHLAVRQDLPLDAIAYVNDLSVKGAEAILRCSLTAFEQSYSILALLERSTCETVLDINSRIKAEERSRSLQREIARHSGDCHDCQATLGGQPSAREIFAALPLASMLSSDLAAHEPAPAGSGSGLCLATFVLLGGFIAWGIRSLRSPG